MRLLLLLLLVPVLAQAAPAQVAPGPPDAERLLYGWIDGQREAARRVAGPGPAVLTFTERATRRFDGLRGGRTIETESAVTWDADDLRRRLLRARVDGQPLTPDEVERLEERLDQAHGPELRLLRRAPILSSRLFAGFAPTGPTELVVRDGRRLWRVDAEPIEDRPEAARARLYFAADRRDRPRLVRAELDVVPPLPRRGRRGPPPDVRVRIEAEFDRPESGLDLAARQRVEAVVEQRRRLRTFSVGVTADLRFSDYQLRPRP